MDLRGFIITAIQWDDVADPASLLAKAQHTLPLQAGPHIADADRCGLVTGGSHLDQFQIGDNIHVISAPHGVDAWFEAL